jgi:transcriptional regulator with XRE-family HTH domain
MPIDELIGTRVRQVRKNRELSQEELGAKLAALLGSAWPKQMVSSVERGRRSISVKELLAFAVALDVPAWQLLEPGDPEQIIRVPVTTRHGRRVIQMDGRAVVEIFLGPLAGSEAPRVVQAASTLQAEAGRLRYRLDQLDKALRGIGQPRTEEQET